MIVVVLVQTSSFGYHNHIMTVITSSSPAVLGIRPTAWLWSYTHSGSYQQCFASELHHDCDDNLRLVQTSSVAHLAYVITVMTFSYWLRPAVLGIWPISWLWWHPHTGSDQQCWASDLHHDCDDILMLVQTSSVGHLTYIVTVITYCFIPGVLGIKPTSWLLWLHPDAGSDQWCWASEVHHDWNHSHTVSDQQCWASKLHHDWNHPHTFSDQQCWASELHHDWNHPHTVSDQQCWASDLQNDCGQVFILV